VLSAHTTLRRATRFLGAGLAAGEGMPARLGAGPFRAKVLGNGLRELDRFLNVLVDEVAASHGLDLPTERNTANKLGRLRPTLAGERADHARLRALGRSRECLFHCNGRVRRGDSRTEAVMTAGWPADAPRRFAVGEELTMSADELAEVCAFYLGIADRLLVSATPS
jgi:hypothetical protein